MDRMVPTYLGRGPGFQDDVQARPNVLGFEHGPSGVPGNLIDHLPAMSVSRVAKSGGQVDIQGRGGVLRAGRGGLQWEFITLKSSKRISLVSLDGGSIPAPPLEGLLTTVAGCIAADGDVKDLIYFAASQQVTLTLELSNVLFSFGVAARRSSMPTSH